MRPRAARGWRPLPRSASQTGCPDSAAGCRAAITWRLFFSGARGLGQVGDEREQPRLGLGNRSAGNGRLGLRRLERVRIGPAQHAETVLFRHRLQTRLLPRTDDPEHAPERHVPPSLIGVHMGAARQANDNPTVAIIKYFHAASMAFSLKYNIIKRTETSVVASTVTHITPKLFVIGTTSIDSKKILRP